MPPLPQHTRSAPSSVRSRRGQFGLLAGGAIAVVLVLGAASVFMRGGSSSSGAGDAIDVFSVTHGSFDVTIPTSGELAALNQIEIRSRLESEATITYIIPEGQNVAIGDTLIRFSDDQLLQKIRDAVDDVNVAEADAIGASSQLDIALKEREANLAKANVDIQLAELALMAWKDGEDKSMRQELALELESSQKDFDRLTERYEVSKSLAAQEFISRDELKQDEISLIQARAALEKARLDLEVYEKYTFLQDKATKESDLDQARSERARVEEKANAEVRSAQSELDSKKYQLESKKQRLEHWNTQQSFCVVVAPSAGLVVYSNSLESSGWGRNEGQPPQVGTSVSPNERIIVLPDTSRIVAVVKVPESISGQIQPGQTAIVTSDALPDTRLIGTVQSIGVLAESGGWRDPNRRDYSVRILLNDDNSRGLKPSMRCKAEIAVGAVSGALYVPVQAVTRRAGAAVVFVADGAGWAERQVATGNFSDLFQEITDGLNEGDVVLLREPRLGEITSRLDLKEPTPEQNAAMQSPLDPDALAPVQPQAGPPDRAGDSAQSDHGDKDRSLKQRDDKDAGDDRKPRSNDDHAGDAESNDDRDREHRPAPQQPDATVTPAAPSTAR